MLKASLKNWVKDSKALYTLYFYSGSLFIRILRLFVPVQNNLILFVSFGGKKFDDSPKAIFDYMRSDARFNDFQFLWAFENPESRQASGAKKIKIDTLSYYIQALRAKYWITNSGIERGLSFKRQSTFLLNTWHGTPIKKIGKDALNASQSYAILGKYKEDIMLAQGKYEADIFSKAFCIDRNKYRITGLPRNDVLADRSEKTKLACREKLGVSKDKKVILYAPTFREYERDTQRRITLAPPLNFHTWKQILGEDYVIFFRAHYEVVNVLNICDADGFVRNVSDEQLNDLIIASDMLVSDYSSIFFDYAIQEKPMFCFAYDYDTYKNTRGMYFELKDFIPGGIKQTEEQLVHAIRTMNMDENIRETCAFRDRYIDTFGTASQQSAEIILNEYNKS